MDKTRIIHFVQKAGGHFYTEMLASKPAQKREGVSFTIEQLLEFAEMIAKYKREPLTDEQIDAEHDKLFPAPVLKSDREKVRVFARAIHGIRPSDFKEKNT